MVHSMMSEYEMTHHLNRVLSHQEMRKLIDQAHFERSEAFVGLFTTMGNRIKKCFVK